MKFIYVAGPYTIPDPAVNTRNAILFANELIALGFVPFVPHLTHLWHLISPKEYEVWLEYDNEWLKKCDALIRMWGQSSGADKEVALAESLGIPIFYSIDDLRRAIGKVPQE